MSIKTPTELVDEFKKSGEFDRLRRELFTQFAQQTDSVDDLRVQVEEITRKIFPTQTKVTAKGENKTRDELCAEIMLDLEGYPIVERAISKMLDDSDFSASIRSSAEKILKNDREKSKDTS